MNKKEVEVFPERVMVIGLGIIFIMIGLVICGLILAIKRGYLRYDQISLFYRIVIPFVTGIGLATIGYLISRKWHKLGNLLQGVGSVLAILMFFLMVSLGGWFVYASFYPLVSSVEIIAEFVAFVLTLVAFAVGGFLLAKGISEIVQWLPRYPFSVRRRVVFIWAVFLILVLTLIGGGIQSPLRQELISKDKMLTQMLTAEIQDEGLLIVVDPRHRDYVFRTFSIVVGNEPVLLKELGRPYGSDSIIVPLEVRVGEEAIWVDTNTKIRFRLL